MTVPFVAAPNPRHHTGTTYEQQAREYAERYADNCERTDRTLGLPEALSRQARPERIAAAEATALRHFAHTLQQATR